MSKNQMIPYPTVKVGDFLGLLCAAVEPIQFAKYAL
jgi:hypothetical protein